MVTSPESGTNVRELAAGIYRINTPITLPVGAFSFNQYLMDDDEPLLFHTGPRQLFPLVHYAAEAIMPCHACAILVSRTSKPTSAAR